MEIKMAKDLSSRINSAEYEKSIYKFSLEKKLFHADEYYKKPAYSIAIPASAHLSISVVSPL